MMHKASLKTTWCRSNSTTSSEGTPKNHYFISKQFISPEPKDFPLPTFDMPLKL